MLRSIWTVCSRWPDISFSYGRNRFVNEPFEEWRGLPEPEEKADRTLSIREVLVQLAPTLGLEARLREEEIFLSLV